MTTLSKTQALVEANRKRQEAARLAEEQNAEASPRAEENLSDAEVEGLRDAAEEKAEVKVQAAAGTLDGEIDIDAMGDVKGDGRDAKDYDDDDPDKALGVPVWEHGLASTKDGVDEAKEAVQETAFGHRTSSRTQAEIERGRQAIEGRKDAARARPASRTVVTDAKTDEDGKKGASVAEKRAEEEKKKADADKKAEAKKENSK